MTEFNVPADWQSAGLWYPVINKKFKNVQWKTDDDLKRNFLTFEEAVSCLQKDVIDHNPNVPVALAYCFRQSHHIALDVDLDKQAVSNARFKTKDYDESKWRDYLPDDKFKQGKIALVEHAIQNHHTRRSTNGGFHIVCLDPTDEIQKIANGKEKIGPRDNYLCEVIFRTILFVTPTVANDKPIVQFTPELIDWYRQRKKKTLVSRPLQTGVQSKVVSQPKVIPQSDFVTDIFDSNDRTVSDSDLQRIRDQLKEFVNVTELGIENVSFLLARDEERFFHLAKCLVGILPVEEFVDFCRTQPFVLKRNQTEDQYFQDVEGRFKSLKPAYTVESQLKQFFALAKERANEIKPLLTQAVEKSPIPTTPLNDHKCLKRPMKVSRDQYDRLPIVRPTRPLDVPSKKIVTVFGPSNVGKTSIVLYDVVENYLKSGKRVLVINNDMLHSEIRPYLYSFGFEDKFDLHVFDEETVMTKRILEKALREIKPDLLVADTLDTMLLQCDSNFSFDSWQTCEMAISWLKQIIQAVECGVLGIFHTPKAPPNCFGLPHSAKLKGAIFQSWLVMDFNHAEGNKWHRKEIRDRWSSQPEGTILVYPDKVRAGHKAHNGYFVRFDGKVNDSQTLAGDWKPDLPSVWKPLPLAMSTPKEGFSTDVFDKSKTYTRNDMLLRISQKAGGAGEGFKIPESEALKSINCYGDRQADDAEHRLKLYEQAKHEGVIGHELVGQKGTKIWIALIEGKSDANHEYEKQRSQGWQY